MPLTAAHQWYPHSVRNGGVFPVTCPKADWLADTAVASIIFQHTLVQSPTVIATVTGIPSNSHVLNDFVLGDRHYSFPCFPDAGAGLA